MFGIISIRKNQHNATNYVDLPLCNVNFILVSTVYVKGKQKQGLSAHKTFLIFLITVS